MRTAMLAVIALISQTGAVSCSPLSTGGSGSPASYLFVWAGDEDEKDDDFLAVIDVKPGSASYGRIVATLPVGARATMPHHTEYETPPGGVLFANGWKAGRTFLLDVSNPLQPKLAGQFSSAGDYGYPHSFTRLANGNVLAIFQSVGEKYAPPGGLVEMDNKGKVLRAAPSATPDISDRLNWPYSLTIHPTLDRVITTSTEMGMPSSTEWAETRHVQIWSTSDLKLLATLALPESGKGRHHIWPAEPRVLADGTVYVNTFSCGLYRLRDLGKARPEAEFVYAFPGGTSAHDMCGVPLVYGNYWIQTVPALPGLVVLDVSNPERPVEVSRLQIDKRFHMPHWIAADRKSGRIVVTMDNSPDVLLLRFDEDSGKLTHDETFREPGAAGPGVSFDRAEWPHGETGKAVVHGAVFSN